MPKVLPLHRAVPGLRGHHRVLHLCLLYAQHGGHTAVINPFFFSKPDKLFNTIIMVLLDNFRAVEPVHRSLALGIESIWIRLGMSFFFFFLANSLTDAFLTILCLLPPLLPHPVRILGTLPGPVVFGLIIDKSCLLWQQHSCDTEVGSKQKLSCLKKNQAHHFPIPPCTQDSGNCIFYDNETMAINILASTYLVQNRPSTQLLEFSMVIPIFSYIYIGPCVRGEGPGRGLLRRCPVLQQPLPHRGRLTFILVMHARRDI